MDSTVLYGDAMGHVWWLWAKISGFWVNEQTNLICAPFGFARHYGSVQPLYELLFFLPAKLLGELKAHNLILFSSFPLTAFTTYIFLFYVLRDHLAGCIGGVLFGFCSGAVSQGLAGHLSFSFNFLLPVFLLTLFYHRSHRTVISSLLIGATYSCLSLLCLYWGYFTVFVGATFVAFDCWTSKQKSKVDVIKGYVPGVVLALIVLVVVLYPAMHFQAVADREVLQNIGFKRSTSHFVVYAAYPWEYILPSMNHPFFGKGVERIFQILHHGSNYFEQGIYLGIIPILFSFLGVRLYKQRTLPTSQNEALFFFLSLGLFMFLLSFPPYFPLGPVRIPLLSYPFIYLVPMFRAYARAGIFVSLALACATAIVISYMRTRGRSAWLILLVPLFLFDTWNVSPAFFEKLETPRVYTWLADQPGDFIVAEYPMMPGDEASFYQYVFWQRIHKKRMVNGALSENKPAMELYQKVSDLSDPETLEVLRRIGVQYVIVHEAGYSEGPIPKKLKRYFPPDVSARMYDGGVAPRLKTLKPVQRFGSDVVYRLD